MNFPVIGLFFIVLAISLIVTLLLSKSDNWQISFVLVLAGFVFTILKIWAFQQAPQWQDVIPDSVTYDLNARAFVLHGQGIDVEVEKYNLRGLIERARISNKPFWSAEESLPYASVYGSAAWFYVAYLHFWYWAVGPNPYWAIYSNAALASFFPAATFGIATILGASKRIAGIAALITLIDPTTGVNASWMLKDTLVGFLTLSSVWSALNCIDKLRLSSLIIFIVSLTLLSASRIIAYIGILAAIGCLCVYWIQQKEFKLWLSFLLSVILVVVLSASLYLYPKSIFEYRKGILYALRIHNTQLFSGSKDTFVAKPGDSSADEAVLKWKTSVRENPLLAIGKSTAHTLFAPFPWVALHLGHNWRSFSELYYPGVILWIFCLPGIFFQIIQEVRKPRPVGLFVLIFWSAILIAYTIFYGEWSTRQRGFVLPVLFSMSAMGWYSISKWCKDIFKQESIRLK
jgi:hypothetical protein